MAQFFVALQHYCAGLRWKRWAGFAVKQSLKMQKQPWLSIVGGTKAYIPAIRMWQALRQIPGIHIALALAGAFASYINLGLLWIWLRKSGVYQRQPGWGRYVARLLVASAVMTGLLLLGLHWTPDFSTLSAWQRVLSLAALVVGGAMAYASALLLLGFRARDMRDH